MTGSGNRKSRGTKKRGNGEGSPWEVRKGVWRWQLTLGYKGKKRITTSGTTYSKREAFAALAKATADRDRGLLASPDNVTVSEYAERWLARHRQAAPATLNLYSQELGYALEHIGPMKVREVRAPHIKDLMVTLSERVMQGGRGKGKPMSPRTQSKVLARLRALFREAVSDQIIYVSPVEGVRKVKTPGVEAVGKIFDFHEAARFHELGVALHEAKLCRLWPAMFTAVSTGMRRGEVLGLTWECVDFSTGVLRVRRQLVQRKDGSTILEPHLKTRASRRDIHMPESLKTALLAHRQRQLEERERAGAAWVDTDAVFATEVGDWTTPDRLNGAMAAVIRWSQPEAGKTGQGGVGAVKLALLRRITQGGAPLPELTPHDLRHTFATLALRRRVPVEVVSKILGHARVSITMDIYRHVLESERREHTVDLFDVILGHELTRPLVHLN